MKRSILCGAAVAALALCAGSAHAGLLYDFETTDAAGAADGFTNNNGITASASTTGATHGSGSLRLIAPSGFNGVYTTSDLPADLANPALSAITLDATLTAQSGGTFSNLGFSFFVSNPTLGDFGEPWGPPTSDWPTSYFAGQQLGLSIPVVGDGHNALNSLSFPALLASGYSVTGFQFLVSNNGTTVQFVDNVQGVVPEPASLSVLGLVGCVAVSRRRRK